MSDIKKIKDEFLLRLNENLDLIKLMKLKVIYLVKMDLFHPSLKN